MNYRLFGRTGLRVSELCLGTMTFGVEWGWGADKETSKKIFDAFVDAGGNFIDTANRYTEGTSEKYVGEFIHSRRDHFVLATKYTLFDEKEDPNFSGNHRKNMFRSVETSLKRLNTDYIDILYLHAWDFTTPVEEILKGMEDLIHSGKVLYAGISDTPAWVVARANAIAELRGWTRFEGLQIEYNLLQRTVERELIPLAENTDMTVVAWAPLAAGSLTGKYLDKNDENKRLSKESVQLNEKNQTITREVVAIAEEMNCSPAHIALRWIMEKSKAVIPVVGARRLEQIGDILRVMEVEIGKEALRRLDEISRVDLGFPHEFLKRPYVRSLIHGDTYEKLINHRRGES